MAADAASPGAGPPLHGGPPPPPAESPLQAVSALLAELPGLVTDRIELFKLEVGAAGAALVRIALMVVAAALVGATTWLALWAALAGALMWLGLHWALALLAVAAANAVAAVLALRHARAQLQALQMRATRRHLFSLSPSTSPRDALAERPAAAAAVAREPQP